MDELSPIHLKYAIKEEKLSIIFAKNFLHFLIDTILKDSYNYGEIIWAIINEESHNFLIHPTYS